MIKRLAIPMERDPRAHLALAYMHVSVLFTVELIRQLDQLKPYDWKWDPFIEYLLRRQLQIPLNDDGFMVIQAQGHPDRRTCIPVVNGTRGIKMSACLGLQAKDEAKRAGAHLSWNNGRLLQEAIQSIEREQEFI